MNNNFSLFLLFSVLLTGLIISPAYAQEPPVNATDTMTESNSTSTDTMIVEDELETEVTTEDEMTEIEVETMEEVPPTIPSPLKQIKEGTMPENIVCKEGLGLVFKLTGQPACVKTTSIEKLIAWGWAR